jgi:glycosyltransferase involved in cell wall biosynthesis
MRICLIGKYPPIQGGVSMRTYWAAHGLAAHGHEVHVVTNAKEVGPPFRMHMRSSDWKRCEATYGGGSVKVHWTDPIDCFQSYIPMASPFVSKLAGIAARLHSEAPFDVIYSHYLEPYGVAACLSAQAARVPHVVRMAGSDAGRLWHHPQFEALYDHVLRSADIVIATGKVAERAIRHGVDPGRIAPGGGFVVPEDLFTPDGPMLDPALLRAEVEAEPDLQDLLWGDFTVGWPYLGIYGKLGRNKGSFALLAAMHRLKQAGLQVGLLALAHGPPAVERAFRARARRLGLADRILQIPFLPHWRVPEFLRGSIAVCCLEQDFPIGFHSPMIPREILLCGTCLVASAEVIRKLPGHEQLPHGYGCVIIEDVNDANVLSDRLAAIVQDREPAAALGARGRSFALELQRDVPFPRTLERILEVAAGPRAVRSPADMAAEPPAAQTRASQFPLTQLALTAIEEAGLNDSGTTGETLDLEHARQVLATIEQRSMHDGTTELRRLAQAVRLEVAIAETEAEAELRSSEDPDPLFRLRMRRWAMGNDDLAALVPVRDPSLRIIEFDYDISAFRGAQAVSELLDTLAPGPSYIVVFGRSMERQREPLLVDTITAQILRLSDGTRTVSDIIGALNLGSGPASENKNIDWFEKLFVQGLLWLQDTPVTNSDSRNCRDIGASGGR